MRHSFSLLPLVVLGACATAPTPSAQAPTPVDVRSEATFTASVARRLSALSGQNFEIVAPLTLTVRATHLQVNLDRLWFVCQRDDASCVPEVDRMAEVAKQAAQPAASATADTIVSALRTDAYLAAARGRGLISEPHAGGLFVVLLVDTPQAARSAGEADLAALGLTAAEALARGRDNAIRLAGGVQAQVEPIGKGQIGTLAAGNFYASSLLLDLDGWRAVASLVPGALVAAVPAADILLYKWVVDDEDGAAFRAIVAMVASQSQRPLSPRVFRWTGDGWAE